MALSKEVQTMTAIELKFGKDLLGTAQQSYYTDTRAATIRFKDEKGIEKGDMIQIIDPNDNVFGYATVTCVHKVPIWDALDTIALDTVRKGPAIYPCNSTKELLEKLNEYYDERIGPTHPVKVIVYVVDKLYD